MTTILIIAGESSGDLHGANLARELAALAPGARLVGAGGPRMRDAGVELAADALYRRLLALVNRERPDAAVLIDFPDFNLRFAPRLKERGIPTAYYISPQVWAWRPGRARTIGRLADRLLVIFDFEVAFYRKYGVSARHVGHPLMDAMAGILARPAAKGDLGVEADETLVGLMPGSRAPQFARIAPVVLGAAERIAAARPRARFVLAAAPALPPALVRRALRSCRAPVSVAIGRSLELLSAADLAIVASGTATLEAAILGTPMIVTYRVNPLTAFLLGPLVRTDAFAMANIVAGRRVVPELLQSEATAERLAAEAERLLAGDALARMRADLRCVRERLGGPGASRRAAEEVLGMLPRP
jgi:lipid-A-disaccharide synthase